MALADATEDKAQAVVSSTQDLASVLRDHARYSAHLQGGKKADLRFAQFQGVDLTHRNLSCADLAGIDLQNAILRYAEFVSADMQCADLRHIDGRCCNFSYADMRGSLLSGSNLNRATMDYADFRPGRLLRMGPRGMKEVLIRCGSAEHTDFSECSLSGTSFEGANLQGANFQAAIIHAASFKNAHITGANFEGAVLSYIQLDELRLSDAVLKTCIFAPLVGDTAGARARLTQMLQEHQRWIDSNAVAGHCAVLDGEDLRPLGQSLRRHKLTAVSARRCIAVATNFSGMELQGINFEDADLRGANFEGADLRGARLRGAKLSHARFRDANVGSLLLRSGERLAFDVFRAEIHEDQLADVRNTNTSH